MAEPKVIAKIKATKRGGFFRAGRHWPRSWTEIRDGELTEAQFIAVVDEPMLVVERCNLDEEPKAEAKAEAPAPAKDQAKPEAKAPAKDEEKPKDGKGKGK